MDPIWSQWFVLLAVLKRIFIMELWTRRLLYIDSDNVEITVLKVIT